MPHRTIPSCSPRALARPALLAVALLAPPAHAQWAPYQHYSIARLGFYDAAHTGPNALQLSTPLVVNAAGQVIGTSNRYNSFGTNLGQDSWVSVGTTTVQIGLTGGDYLASNGSQYSTPFVPTIDPGGPFPPAGVIAGTSRRYAIQGNTGYTSQEVWAFNGTSTTQIGLNGPEYGIAQRYSDITAQLPSGAVLGYTQRVGPNNSANGQDPWIWNGSGTTLLGFTDADHTTSAGRRSSQVTAFNSTGLVAGGSPRYTAAGDALGTDVWLWNGSSLSAIPGLTGPDYLGPGGYRASGVDSINDAGQIAGTSARSPLGLSNNGQDAWVYRAGVTTQIGLLGPAYTGSAGFRNSSFIPQNKGDLVVGYTQRITGVNTNNGIDAWVWDGAATRQIGFTGPGYTRGDGYQSSHVFGATQSGQIAGTTAGFGATTNTGQDAWTWRAGVTTRYGLYGPANSGAAGYHQSDIVFQNEAGQVVGTSGRFSGLSGVPVGQDAWASVGATTVQIGLTGGSNTSSAGIQNSTPTMQTVSSLVAGTSKRYNPANGTENGQDTWIFNRSATTLQVGLTGPTYTGSTGFRYSIVTNLTDNGAAAGTSRRVSGVNSSLGDVAWFFDPSTSTSYPIIGSIRTTDQFASSYPWAITPSGFVLGSYTFFQLGLGDGEERAFIFRPDLGFNDLGNLVVGNLGDSGFRTLRNPRFVQGLDEFVGMGYALNQIPAQAVYRMVIPAPGAALLLLAPLASLGRRRRPRAVTPAAR